MFAPFDTPGPNEMFFTCKVCGQKIFIGLVIQAGDDPARWRFEDRADLAQFMLEHTHNALFPFELTYRYGPEYAKREADRTIEIHDLTSELALRLRAKVSPAPKAKKK